MTAAGCEPFPHVIEHLCQQGLFCFCCYCSSRQWRRGACRRTDNTTSARLSVLDGHTYSMSVGEKGLLPRQERTGKNIEQVRRLKGGVRPLGSSLLLCFCWEGFFFFHFFDLNCCTISCNIS